MAIDNPYDAIDQQYPEEEGGAVSAIAKFFAGAKELEIPMPPFIAQFFGFLDNKSKEARIERGLAFVRQLVEDIQRIEGSIATMRTDMDEVQGAMNMALEYDVEEFNNAKRDRYISVITHAISSDTKVKDLTGFIQDTEKLGERDLIGLKVLNSVMNRQGDWREQAPPPQANPPKLHPNTFNTRAQELAVQMAHALTGRPASTDGNTFSREEGLQICLRLQGFGLAEMVGLSPREVPISNYCARLTTRGLMLLRLLGENVPNWEQYFDQNGAR
jgi:hypothetical protein